MMKKYNDIGDLYRDTFSNYTPQPPSDVWNNIQGKMNGRKPLWKKLVFPVAGLVLVTVAAYLLFANLQTETATLLTENNQVENTSLNVNLQQEETAATEISAQNDISTISVSQGEENAQNQERTSAQAKEESNTINDNFAKNTVLFANENQGLETKKSAAEQTTETSRVSENPTAKEVQPKKYLQAIVSRDTSICENTEAHLFVRNVKNIRWSTGETKNRITVNPSFDERYSVAFTTDAGKDSMAYIYVKVLECVELYIPNAFTPNGDGLNDIFIAKANMNLDYFEMNIYTLGGRQLLFTSKNINQGWDGSYRGQAQAQGAYNYTIRYKDSFGKLIEKRGELLLILQ